MRISIRVDSRSGLRLSARHFFVTRLPVALGLDNVIDACAGQPVLPHPSFRLSRAKAERST
jgi:hypothetical protein